MPNYLRPQWRMILKITGHNIKSFLSRLKGTFLILVTLIGILGAINSKGEINVHMKDSILADVAKKATVLLYPIGFTDDDWQATVGLISGAVAKETVVGTMTAIYAQTNSNADNNIHKDHKQNLNLTKFVTYMAILLCIVVIALFVKKKFLKNSQMKFMSRPSTMKIFTHRFKVMLILFIILSGIAIAHLNTSTIPAGGHTFMGLLAVIKQELLATKDIFIDGIQSSFNYNVDSTIDNDDIKIIQNNAGRFKDVYLTYGFLLFILAYFPCFATFSMAVKDGGMKIALFSGLWSLTLAYVIAGTFFCLTHLDTISTTRLITELVILWGVLGIEILVMQLMSKQQHNKMKQVIFS